MIYSLYLPPTGSSSVYEYRTDYVDNLEFSSMASQAVVMSNLSRVYNPEGYVTNCISTYDPQYSYYRKDHLGNNREVWRASYVYNTTTVAASTTQRTQYYPSGLPWASNTGDNPSTQLKKYNGKEFLEMHGYDTYDYGARGMYPAIGGSFMSVDPLCEKYYSISPYAYCAGNPVNAVDPDGRLVFFINGMHAGTGGKSEYWGGFDKQVMNQVKDWNSVYIDGSHGGRSSLPWNLSADERKDVGYNRGKDYASLYLFAYKNDDGSFKESIKVITHSMGAAYAKGFIKGLIDAGVPINMIEFEADFAPFQPTKQTAVEGVKTYQFSNDNDNVANNKALGSPYGEIEGVTKVTTDNDPNKKHAILDFVNKIKALPQGTYKVVDGKIVTQ